MYHVNGIWYIRVAGRPISSRTRDRKKARELQEKLNSEAWERKNGLVVPTWAKMVKGWMEDEPIAASKYWNVKAVDWWNPFLKGKRASEITPALINKIICEHRKVSFTERKPENATANAYVQFVKRVIRSQSNLNPKFTTYPAMLGRDRWITPEEWASLRAEMDEDTREILEFALVTGLREANCMFFEWGWQRGDSVVIPASATKTSTAYGLPLNKTALGILKRRAQKPVKHVRLAFTHNGKEWYRVKLLRALKRACKRSGVGEVTVHGLRHSFATWLAQNGVPKDVRMKLMGHSAKDVHDRYTHFDVESLRRHSEVIDAVIETSQSASEGSQVLAMTA